MLKSRPRLHVITQAVPLIQDVQADDKSRILEDLTKPSATVSDLSLKDMRALSFKEVGIGPGTSATKPSITRAPGTPLPEHPLAVKENPNPIARTL